MTPDRARTPDYSQTKRSIEHVLPLGLAFTLTIFPLWLVFTLSILAIIYGAFLSKFLSKTTFRDFEKKQGYSVGKIAYAVSVFILLLLFHGRMHVVAGAWAVMALGDPAATIAGKKWGQKSLPWNSKKTWVGTTAFTLAASAGCFLLLWYSMATAGIGMVAPWWSLIAMAFCTAVVGAFFESSDLGINDNFTVPLSAGILLYIQTRILIL